MSATTLPGIEAAPRTGRRRSPRAARRRRLVFIADHALLIALALAFVAPIVFMVLTALMSNDQALSSKLWPQPFEWGNLGEVFRRAALWRYTANTMLYACLATILFMAPVIVLFFAAQKAFVEGVTLTGVKA